MVRLFCLLSLITQASIAATITVNVDRNPIHINESVECVFEAKGRLQGKPDFKPLYADFDIINQTASTQMTISNGQQSRSQTWTLTLMAKKTGNLIIPAISFGQDHSTAQILTVLAASQSTDGQKEEVFIEVEATPTNPYVQSQIHYTVRVFYAISLNQLNLSEPRLSSGEMIIKQLGEDSQYETKRHGKRFGVFERQYALFPQHSGKVTIAPLISEVHIIEGRGFRAKSRLQRIRSKSIALNVKAIPSSFTGNTWLPAKNISLQETWSEKTSQFKVGKAITRTLTLFGEGLMVGQLPEFSLSHDPKIKQYADQPTLEEQDNKQGVLSLREEKIALMPSEAGEYTLPEIRIPWWNTQTDRLEMATLPARQITVLPATIDPNAMPLAPLIIQNTSSPIQNQPMASKTHNIWMWISLLLAIAWIVTLIAWWYHQRPRPIPKEKPISDHAAFKKIKQACHHAQPIDAKEAILNWAKIHWQDSAPNNLGDIAQRCGAQVSIELQTLNQILYSPHTEKQWEGKALWHAFKTYHVQQTRMPKKTGKSELAPMVLT